MISLSACASLSSSSMDTGVPPEHVKAKSSSESDLGSSAQDHHTGFCPTGSRCKIPLHDPHTNQAYFCLRTSTFTHGFLPIYTWLVPSTYFLRKKKYIYIYIHILQVTMRDLFKTLRQLESSLSGAAFREHDLHSPESCAVHGEAAWFKKKKKRL